MAIESVMKCRGDKKIKCMEHMGNEKKKLRKDVRLRTKFMCDPESVNITKFIVDKQVPGIE